MWGFNSTLSGVINTILAKIEGRAYNAGNMPNQQNAIQGNIIMPQMNNPNVMVSLINFYLIIQIKLS